MSKKKIEEIVSELALPIVSEHLFELVDVEFVKEGSNWYLRVYIDKPEGITIDDCGMISEILNAKLDEVNPIVHGYFFEVSSPGLERPLKKERDFERNKGKDVEVKVYEPIDGIKAFEGELIGLIDDKIVIKADKGKILEFKKDKVALVKKTIKF